MTAIATQRLRYSKGKSIFFEKKKQKTFIQVDWNARSKRTKFFCFFLFTKRRHFLCFNQLISLIIIRHRR